MTIPKEAGHHSTIRNFPNIESGWIPTIMDRDEVSLGEYLAFLRQRKLQPSDELQKLIWHVITIHSVSDQTLTRWPALYVT